MIYPACQIPVLPSGKIDYITLEKQFLEQKETMETV